MQNNFILDSESNQNEVGKIWAYTERYMHLLYLRIDKLFSMTLFALSIHNLIFFFTYSHLSSENHPV